MSDCGAFDPRRIARCGKMPGRRRRRSSPDRHVGFSHAPRSEHFPSRGSREILFRGGGTRPQTIWLALVDQPPMGQDLLRRMAAAGVVERRGTMALNRGMSEISTRRYESQCLFDRTPSSSFGVGRHWFPSVERADLLNAFQKRLHAKICRRTYAIIVRFPPISRAYSTIAVDSITHTTVGFDQRVPMCSITAVGMGGYFGLDSGLRPHGVSN